MLGLVGLVGVFLWLAWLDYSLVKRFEQRHLAAPSHVYSRPVEWYPGSPVDQKGAVAVLESLGYRRGGDIKKPGSFAVSKGKIDLHIRKFEYDGGLKSAVRIRLDFSSDSLGRIVEPGSGRQLPVLLLDPVVVGTIQSRQQQDRRLRRLHEFPDELLQILLLVEDRHFLTHHGIDPSAIARAVFANIKSGRVAQGGSTITQQLVKNLFLSSQRTLGRKVKEALYAVFLELHFDKHEILEAYLNEVFLAQAGNRAIHGFALASEFFFGRPLSQLELKDFALLVGMVKAPSAYNPRRNPKRAMQRRAVVLNLLAAEDIVTANRLKKLVKAPLGVTARGEGGGRPYSAFLDLVRRQVPTDEIPGLSAIQQIKVWSTLDLSIQRAAEQALAQGLGQIEKQRGIRAGSLQGAIVVLRAESGRVLALVGDRRSGFAGFNRALDARRPVGSLLKPVIALTALESGADFHLATMIDDEPLKWKLADGSYWTPGNYDGKSHGMVPMVEVVGRSYNIASARLGLDVGINRFVRRLSELGQTEPVNAFPSALLGAVEMSPFEVAQLYLPFASGGLGFPLRAFVSVTDENHRKLLEYRSGAKRLIRQDTHYLVNFLLQDVVNSGTAAAGLGAFGTKFSLAGKTGTTDDYRDSWFAGYSGNYVAVVWVGRDDNGSTGLSGASGALTIWGDLMRKLPLRRTGFITPDAVKWYDFDPANGQLAGAECPTSRKLPFVGNAIPVSYSDCGGFSAWSAGTNSGKWRSGGRVKRWFNSFLKPGGAENDDSTNTSGRR